MVHFPADYSHELYGSLHKNIIDVVLFKSPTSSSIINSCGIRIKTFRYLQYIKKKLYLAQNFY